MVYDGEAHQIAVRHEGRPSVGVEVFQAAKVHISVRLAKGDGKPTVKVLMTDPPLGEQPGDPPSLPEAALGKRKEAPK